ncbi:TPA: hypothetical protein ACID8W_006762, partial [Pseudomonas aeruginosa]
VRSKMSKYVHDPAPNERARQFIRWCAENINEWPSAFLSCARCYGGGKKSRKWWARNVEWREHHSSLSHSWAVCTQRQWEEMRAKLGMHANAR